LHGDAIDCVLLDMTMPRMSGQEAFDAIRNINPQAKIVISSGYSEDATHALFENKGLNGFIQKPYMPDSMAAKLHEVIGKKVP